MPFQAPCAIEVQATADGTLRGEGRIFKKLQSHRHAQNPARAVSRLLEGGTRAPRLAPTQQPQPDKSGPPTPRVNMRQRSLGSKCFINLSLTRPLSEPGARRLRGCSTKPRRSKHARCYERAQQRAAKEARQSRGHEESSPANAARAED